MSPGSLPLLMTPGPTRVPERVLAAGASPMLHHRTPEFSEALSAVLEMLKPLFGTTGPVLPLHTTGRGGMEAAICNLFSRNDELISCCNGKFGSMWAALAESYGLVVHRVAADWGRSVEPSEVEQALRDHPAAKAVTVVHSDTSTGVLNPVDAVAAVARSSGALTLVDSISGVGGVPFRFDEWGVDLAVTGTQKCLMASPGMAFASVGPRAWQAIERATLPRNYWSFEAIRNTLAAPRPETPGTTPVHLVLQLREALGMIHEEGVEAVFARHRTMAEMTGKLTEELGLGPQCPDLVRRSPTLSAIRAPDGVKPSAVREGMLRRGILVALGLGPYRETAFRIGHMGDIRPTDVERTLDSLTEVLAELGWRSPAPAQTTT